jgi:hypothetical protein
MHTLTPQTAPTDLGRAANESSFVRRPAHLFEVRYQFRNGHKSEVSMISTTRTGAILRVIEMFGEQLRICDAKVLS